MVALTFLTKLPMPRVAFQDGDFAAAIRLYPLVGLLIGVFVAAFAWMGAQVDPWIGALAGLAIWIWITGALHLDGLGDVADGLGAAHGKKNRMLEVMSDPHIGSFGVVAVMLQLLCKLVLISLLLRQYDEVTFLSVAAIPAAARLGPLVWSRALPNLKPEGLGASISGATRRRDLLGWGVLLMGSCLFVAPLIAAPFLLLAITFWVRAKLGGMTGDVHGMGIEAMETGLLFSAVVYASVFANWSIASTLQ